MSRIRTVKPEFWVSEQIISCSLLTRLLFIGLWNFSDDNGVHPASYIRLKAEVFPADTCSVDDIKRCISELINNDLLREYVIENKTYWIVTGWKNHQRIDRPTYRHPLPQSELKKICTSSLSSRRELDDISPTPLQLFDDLSTTEWKGMESNGKEKEICEVKTSPLVVFNSVPSNDTQEVFKHWQTTMKHPKAKLDKKRRSRIETAFKIGYSMEELKQAINGCLNTPFNQGKNDRGQCYDDIELILRDASHIDRFIHNATNPPSLNTKTNGMATDVMTGVI